MRRCTLNGFWISKTLLTGNVQVRFLLELPADYPKPNACFMNKTAVIQIPNYPQRYHEM